VNLLPALLVAPDPLARIAASAEELTLKSGAILM
jgi:hypothetical protein